MTLESVSGEAQVGAVALISGYWWWYRPRVLPPEAMEASLLGSWMGL